MTRDDYRRAVGCFEPDEYLKERIAANMERAPGRRTRALRRALVGVLAAAVALASMTGIAMAASPEIRKAVLSFLHLDEVEQVPDGATVVDTGPVNGVKINERVTAWYVETGAVGLESVRLNDDGTVAAFLDWEIVDGALTNYEIAPSVSSFSVEWSGETYAGEVYWAVIDGALKLDYSTSDLYWYVSSIPGRTDAALLHVSQGVQDDYEEYVYLLHLDTGEAEDCLGGTGIEEIGPVYSYEWSGDCSAALAVTESGTYYCDFSAKTAVEVGELTATGATEAIFAGPDTLFVYNYDGTECSGWSYDISTGQTVQILDYAHIYNKWEENPYGVIFTGARYCVYAYGSGAIAVLDLKTGERIPVEGFEISSYGYFLSNGSNTRMAYAIYSSSTSITELGVLDFTTGEFIAFSREGVAGETVLTWLDDTHIAICAPVSEGQVYMYIYEFT